MNFIVTSFTLYFHSFLFAEFFALQKYYKSLSKPTIKLDYNKLFRNVCTQISNVDFLKGFIFVPKPDEFLMKDKNLDNYYNRVTGMKNAPYQEYNSS